MSGSNAPPIELRDFNVRVNRLVALKLTYEPDREGKQVLDSRSDQLFRDVVRTLGELENFRFGHPDSEAADLVLRLENKLLKAFPTAADT